MPTVKFITHYGAEHEVSVETGTTLMQAAFDNGIPGILADCGGACSCATCHCFIDEAWQAAAGEPDDMEAQMLDFVTELQPNSRLSCQIDISEEMDGLVVRLPESLI